MSKRYMVTYTATFFDQRVVSAEDETTARDMITTSLSHSLTSEHKLNRQPHGSEITSKTSSDDLSKK